MIQTILIVLVAVVVLIVIIAVLALRYLRADDSDTFDEIPDEPRPARPAEQGRERRPAAPARRPRQPEQVTEVWAADRPARTPDSRVPAGFRDRDTEVRPTGPQRAASQATARRETAGSRPVRAGARPDGPDSVTSSWDSLSDVDYWAELAADKPEITPAASGAAAASRHGSEPAADVRPAARPASRGDRADSGQLPIRKRHLKSRPSGPPRLVGAPSARADDSGQTEQIDVRAAQAQPATARFAGDPAASLPNGLGRHGQSRHATGSRPDAPAAQQQRPSGAQRPAGPRQAQSAPAAQPTYPTRSPAPASAAYANGHGPADDDPLTSPSFPAINADDSRSYRTRRSGGASQPGASGQHTRPPAGPADQGSTSHQFIDYSSAPRRVASRSDGYPVEPARAPSQPAVPAAGHQSPAAPTANPYGSYVSQPQPAYSETAQNGYSSAGYPETPAPSLAAASYGGHAAGQQAASAGWYTAPAIASGSPQAAAQPLGQPTDGYLPAAGLGGTGLAGGSHVMNGSPARGYTGIDYSSIRYDDPVYPDAPGVLPGYGSAGQHTTQYDRPGYGSQDSGSSQDGYGAYPGYGTGGR